MLIAARPAPAAPWRTWRSWLRKALRYAWKRAGARLALAGVSALGPGARVRGRPVVENEGEIAIGARFALNAHVARCELYAGPGGRLLIGDDVFVNVGCTLSASEAVTIGDGTAIGPHCILIDHDFHASGLHGATPRRAPIRLGRGVWLASRVTVLKGVTIGDGAVVAAGAVVTRDVPAGAVVAGVPARVIGWTDGRRA